MTLSSGFQTRGRAEFWVWPPTPLTQSSSRRNGKVLALIPAPQDARQTQVKYQFVGVPHSLFFLLEINQHKNNRREFDFTKTNDEQVTSGRNVSRTN